LLSREQTRKGKSSLLQEGGGEPSLATDGGFHMDFMPQQMFIREIERQCTFALMSYEDLIYALAVYQRQLRFLILVIKPLQQSLRKNPVRWIFPHPHQDSTLMYGTSS
jgi:hypothetical protein